MNLYQLRTKKEELEKEILNLIDDFSEETNIEVVSINVSTIDVSTIESPETFLNRIEVEVKL